MSYRKSLWGLSFFRGTMESGEIFRRRGEAFSTGLAQEMQKRSLAVRRPLLVNPSLRAAERKILNTEECDMKLWR
jgi:hypothetical protein